jgi:transcriptional regulator with XRE-family HTH domain
MTHTERTVLCYLRTHRRVWGLTQQELASFMGFESAAHVSRIENGKRTPTVESALACQVLFGIPPSAMFPHAYETVEERVIRDVYERHLALGDTTKPSELRKRELFDLALERATSSPNTPERYEAA